MVILLKYKLNAFVRSGLFDHQVSVFTTGLLLTDYNLANCAVLSANPYPLMYSAQALLQFDWLNVVAQ